ncbi:c-type cytochrome [Halomonas sp. MC140]|nr:c-type cytochrome [Halomonas sp. MC140]MDN7132077.1 c-type cytochrome [Halomonas sp. MC140]
MLKDRTQEVVRVKAKGIISSLMALSVLTGAAGAFAQEDERDAMAERLAPVGKLCLQGQECGTAVLLAAADASVEEEAAASEVDSASSIDTAALYASAGCAVCHANGIAGAPKLGDSAAWAARLAKGTDALYASAINGIGAMPAKGGRPTLSDEEVMALVDYMIAEGQ